MMPLTLQVETGELQRVIAHYATLRRQSLRAVVARKLWFVGRRVREKFARVKPARGAITSERLAALKAGQGVVVRDSVLRAVFEKMSRRSGARQMLGSQQLRWGAGRGRATTRAGLNLQALAVKRELALRERGRGWLAWGALHISALETRAMEKSPGPYIVRARGRYRQMMGTTIFEPKPDESVDGRIYYGSLTLSTAYGAAVSKSRHLAMIRQAIQEEVADTERFLEERFRSG